MVRRWFADLADTTGPVSRSQCYRILHTIMNQAVSDGEITTNPCNIRGASSVKTAERPAPTLPQVHALAELVPSRYSALVLAAAYSGLRFGELTALTRADVTIPGSGLPEFRVVKGIRRVQRKWLVSDPKTQAGVRVVSLPEFLGPVLRQHVDTYLGRGDTSLVFATKSGRPLARSNWTSTFARATAQLGLEGTHFHDTRHAASTAAVQAGATLKDTMVRLGQSSTRAAMIYQHTVRDRDEAIARALDEAAADARQGKSIPLRRIS